MGLGGIDHIQQREDGSPVPHRARGSQLRSEVLVRQLAPSHAVGTLRLSDASLARPVESCAVQHGESSVYSGAFWPERLKYIGKKSVLQED